ncbi:hypothetical protein [Caballeronia catudaia]|uniref:hypothetical protein n=1 Tax=Caballeronia catudaia TaxID=1777136 RepID=UPI0013583E08|nr:hypothetical protein [Caballeronia catudaia]
MHENPRTSVANRIEVTRHGQRTSDAVFASTHPNRDDRICCQQRGDLGRDGEISRGSTDVLMIDARRAQRGQVDGLEHGEEESKRMIHLRSCSAKSRRRRQAGKREHRQKRKTPVDRSEGFWYHT